MCKNEKRKNWPYLVLSFSALIVTAAGIFLFIRKPQFIQTTSQSLSIFGDFFGGFLTPLYALLSFIALLWTISMQRKELSLQREELALNRKELEGQRAELHSQAKSLEQQNFERTFFELLKFRFSVIDSYAVGSITGSQQLDRIRSTVNFKEPKTITKFEPYINSMVIVALYIEENCPTDIEKDSYHSILVRQLKKSDKQLLGGCASNNLLQEKEAAIIRKYMEKYSQQFI